MRLRRSFDTTVFFLIPNFALISAMDKPYQYRATNRFRSVSGRFSRKVLKARIKSRSSIVFSMLQPEGMHSDNSSIAMSASPLPRFSAMRSRRRSTEILRVSVPKNAFRLNGRTGGMVSHAASQVSFTLYYESNGSLRMPFATR